jgi:hypothetical protein
MTTSSSEHYARMSGIREAILNYERMPTLARPRHKGQKASPKPNKSSYVAIYVNMRINMLKN